MGLGKGQGWENCTCSEANIGGPPNEPEEGQSKCPNAWNPNDKLLVGEEVFRNILVGCGLHECIPGLCEHLQKT